MEVQEIFVLIRLFSAFRKIFLFIPTRVGFQMSRF